MPRNVMDWAIGGSKTKTRYACSLLVARQTDTSLYKRKIDKDYQYNLFNYKIIYSKYCFNMI